DAVSVGRIRIGLLDHFHDADHLLLFPGVIEECLLAAAHALQVAPRPEIAHAGPRLSFCSTLDEIVPGKLLGLSLHKPVRHASLLLSEPKSPLVRDEPTEIRLPAPRLCGER